MAALEAARAAEAAEAATAAPVTQADAVAPVLASTVADESDAAVEAADVDGVETAASTSETAPQMRARFPVSLAFMGVNSHAMALERDIDARLASIGVNVRPLQTMQPAPMMRNNEQGNAFFQVPQNQGPQGLYVGGGQAFLPPDG